MSKIGISRRRFIKTGLGCVAAAATSIGTAQIPAADKKTMGVSRTSLKSLYAIPTTCEQCPAGCGIIVYLDGERLVQILGNPSHPNNQGGICTKGIAGINLVNDPERLLYPMKRIGPRGSDSWTRITWDEVYFTLGTRIKEMIRDGRTGELVVDKGQNDSLLDRFITAIGSIHIIDRPALKNLTRDTAFTAMIESPLLFEDVGRSRTILNFGANPYSNHDQFIGIARRLVHARIEKGARLITFDVRMSETAAKSDSWYPIKAGTDGIVALAMAKVIVEKELADKNFLDQKINCSISKIKHHLSPYTPELAEKESGVRAVDIERLAVEFATRKPSVAIIGGGVSDHENGLQNIRCIALLNWLVGNLEKEGGLFFPRFPLNHQGKPSLLSDSRLELSHTVKGAMELQEIDTQIDTYFAYLSNPAYNDPDCESSARFLKDEKSVPFLVVMDTHLTETAMMADMVLPAATYLEGWSISSAPSLDNIPILNLRQPVVSLLSTAKVLRFPTFDSGKLLEPTFQPLGESREIGNLCLELARRIGGFVSASLPFENTQDYVTKITSSIPGLKKQGSFKTLKRQGFWIDKTLKKGYYLNSGKKSTSNMTQKVKIYSDTLKHNGHPPLPEYQPIASHKEMNSNEFIFTTFKSNLTARGASNSKWAREILHENRLWINKKKADRLGIKNGDKVRVISPVSTLITRVLTTSRIHPRSVAMAEGLGHTAIGNVAKARRFKSKDQDTNLIWWSKEGNGVNPNKIIERRTDPISGGQALKDTKIRIEKI